MSSRKYLCLDEEAVFVRLETWLLREVDHLRRYVAAPAMLTIVLRMRNTSVTAHTENRVIPAYPILMVRDSDLRIGERRQSDPIAWPLAPSHGSLHPVIPVAPGWRLIGQWPAGESKCGT